MNYTKIIIPTKLQTDTLLAIFLLKKFGGEKFEGVEKASIEIKSIVNDSDHDSEILIDIGGGVFDHHNQKNQTTASKLVAEYLNINEDVSLKKMLYLAERCDFFGKGIISKDQIDRTFGLPGLLVSVNKIFENNPQKVFEVFEPILEAHLAEERKRCFDLPSEFQEKIKSGEAQVFDVMQRGKKVKCVSIASDDQSMSGYLRAMSGGDFDVVAIWLSSGHCNIITRTQRRVDLRSLVALIRKSEAMLHNIEIGEDFNGLSVSGRYESVPEWYYDPATNSLQNGGINPQGVTPTKIPKKSMLEILKIGLSEELWKPEN